MHFKDTIIEKYFSLNALNKFPQSVLVIDWTFAYLLGARNLLWIYVMKFGENNRKFSINSIYEF